MLGPPELRGPPTDEEWARYRDARDAHAKESKDPSDLLRLLPEGPWHPADRALVDLAMAHVRETGDSHSAWMTALALVSKPPPTRRSSTSSSSSRSRTSATCATAGGSHLKTREVGEVLERTVRRIEKHLRRRDAIDAAIDAGDGADEGAGPEDKLAASAVSGQAPPAGPQWLRGLSPLDRTALGYDEPLCASLDGFTLHAATRVGALDTAGCEALLRYVLRPPLAQERLERRPDGLVRIAIERAYGDGTVAIDMDPLSLLCRLATSVPPPRFHTVKYAGVLAPASQWRSRVAPPKPPPSRPRRTTKSGPRSAPRAATAPGPSFSSGRSTWMYWRARSARGA